MVRTPRVVILALTTSNPRHRAHQRAQQLTWAGDVPPGMRVIWLEGGALKTEFSESLSTLRVAVPEEFENILEKTIFGLQWVLEELAPDFIIRTNTSNYWNLPRVSSTLKELSRDEGILGGHKLRWSDEDLHYGLKSWSYISGSGIWMSRDVAAELASKDPRPFRDLIDDVAIGRILVDRMQSSISIPMLQITNYEIPAPSLQSRVKHWGDHQLTVERMFALHRLYTDRQSVGKSVRSFVFSELRNLGSDSHFPKHKKLVKRLSLASSLADYRLVRKWQAEHRKSLLL